MSLKPTKPKKCKVCKSEFNPFKVNIKPLSVNQAWQGKRFKTPKYKAFEKEFIAKLPAMTVSKNAKIKVIIHYGFSSKLSDIDNPTKLVLDCLVKKYGFDDRQIYVLEQTKEIVKKGNEYISINLSEFNQNQ